MTNVVALPTIDSGVPLCNVEAEAAFLGAVLSHPERLAEVASIVTESDFFEPAHRRIYAAVMRYGIAGRKFTPVMLRPEFEGNDDLKRLGGIAYLARLTGVGEGLLALREIALQLAELSQLRRLDDGLAEARLAIRHGAPVDEVPLPDRDAFRSGGTALPLIDMSGWSKSPPQRVSAWGDWLPLLKTTLLTGEGGVGKSLLAQMLLTCTALGRPFLGMNTNGGNALYITAEDDCDELWRRQRAICRALGINIADLNGRFFLASLDGEAETALARFDVERRMIATSRWQQVRDAARAHDIKYFGFDNATDLMAGDHNDVHEVAAFVNLLTGLAIEQDGVSILLHHPNKSGDDWLGSVAWHNKVRSRLIVKRAEGCDPDARTIENPKANYGPSGGKIEFRWHEGAFVRDEDLPDNQRDQLADIAVANGANAAFMACLAERAAQGDARAVGPKPGPNYAPKQFEGMTQAKGFDRHALKRAMDRLYAIGRISSETVRNTEKGRDVTVIRAVPELAPDLFPNGSRTHPRTLPERFPNTPSPYSPSLREGYGAALEAAAPFHELNSDDCASLVSNDSEAPHAI
jgi:RecA-family ATPase